MDRARNSKNYIFKDDFCKIGYYKNRNYKKCKYNFCNYDYEQDSLSTIDKIGINDILPQKHRLEFVG